MKVTIVTSFPFPEGKATANRIKVFAQELIKTNFIRELDIICCSSGKNEIFYYKPAIKVINLEMPTINKTRLLLRAFRELFFAFKVWFVVRKSSPENIIVTIPSVLLLLPVILFPKKGFLALDIRDAVWTYFSDSSFNIIIKPLLDGLFRIAAKKVDIVSVTNSHEAHSLHNIAGINPVVVPNGISLEKINIYKNIAIKPLLNKVKLTYIGNIGIAQELEILIDLAKIYQSSLNIRIIGDGAKLTSLKKVCLDEKIVNINFYGAIPQKDVAKYMKDSDILFAQIGRNFASAVPTKIFEYIASGRKVLLGLPYGPAREIFDSFAGVEIFEVGDFKGLTASYEKLLKIRFDIVSREKNIATLEAHYLREKTINKYINEIQAILIGL